MKAFNGSVSVTPSPPLDSASGHLFYYAAIHPVAVARSVVLSSILDSKGDAQLPCSVSLADFELWQKAVVDRDNAGKAKHMAEVDMKTVCAILKTADALGDVRFEKWTALAWGLLHRLITYPFKQITEEADLACFVSLPDHIQHLVFMARARCSEEPVALERLLCRLPESIHPSLLAAFSGPERELIVPSTLDSNLIPFFKALNSLPADPPLIQVLVDSDCPLYVSDEYRDQATIAAASALRHHSGLTRLKLSKLCADPLRMQRIAPAIAELTYLHTLELGSHNFTVGTPVIAAFLDAYQSSAQLQHLALFVPCQINPSKTEAASNSRANKSRRIEVSSTAEDIPAEDVPAAHSNCLARLVSCLTRLTFLSITSAPSSEEFCVPANASVPVTLPYLETLHLPGYHSLLPVNLVSNLTAPLKNLSVEIGHLIDNDLHTCDIPCPKMLCASLPKFQLLTSLSLMLGEYHDNGQRTLGAQVSSTFPQLLNLQQLDYHAPFPVVLAGIQSVPPGLKHLTFSITQKMVEGGAVGGWTQLFAAISCIRLCHLDAEFPFSLCGHLALGVASLSTLTYLTSLSLSDWAGCLGQPIDRAALSQMSQLQSLRITGIEPEHAFLPVTLNTLVSLTMLTKLELGVMTCRAQPDAIEWHVPAWAWPFLRSLTFPVHSHRSARTLVRTALTLPALAELHVEGAGNPALMARQEYLLQKRAKKRGVQLRVTGFFISMCSHINSGDNSADSAEDYATDNSEYSTAYCSADRGIDGPIYAWNPE